MTRRRGPSKKGAVGRFEEKVWRMPFHECHEWTGARTEFGHGCFFFEGKLQRAHRVAWRLFRGQIPEGLSVLHSCDRPTCVRPEHLFLGTQADNMRDMLEKGRGHYGTSGSRGAANGNASIAEGAVRLIRALRTAGAKLAEIAAFVGVSKSQVNRICKRESWKHVA